MIGRRTGAAARILDEAGGARVMTGVMAIMVFLTVIAAALGLATAAARGQLDRQLAGRLTVQIVDGDPLVRDRIAARLLTRLRASPDVVRAAPVDAAAVATLLAPWLGGDPAAAGLPVPALIDVDLADAGETVAAQGVRRRVVALARRHGPAVRVEQQAAALSGVGGVMRSLAVLAGLLVVLMAAATAAVVGLAARAGLDAHRPTIEVMHMLGATDRQVARLFQRRLALDAAIGGGAGAAAAAVVVATIGEQMGGLGSELAGAATLSPLGWGLLALVPLGFVLLATGVARVAVVATLARQL